MNKVVRCYKPGGSHEDFTATLTIEKIRERLGGWVEAVQVGLLSVLCDEDGKLKGLPFNRSVGGIVFVGDLYVGKLTDNGLEPVDVESLGQFEKGRLV